MVGENDKSNDMLGGARVAQQPRKPPVRRRISSHALFDSANELVIEHAGDEYRLRITSQGKLILTK